MNRIQQIDSHCAPNLALGLGYYVVKLQQDALAKAAPVPVQWIVDIHRSPGDLCDVSIWRWGLQSPCPLAR